jgi:hypothetical protein
MKWKRILRQAASGDPVEMEQSDFDEARNAASMMRTRLGRSAARCSAG